MTDTDIGRVYGLLSELRGEVADVQKEVSEVKTQVAVITAGMALPSPPRPCADLLILREQHSALVTAVSGHADEHASQRRDWRGVGFSVLTHVLGPAALAAAAYLVGKSG